jgi:hypothetical protein
VDEKNVVQRREVELGKQEGPRRVVAKGLDADDTVVVEGILRVRPGVTVKPNFAAPASPDAAKPKAAAPAEAPAGKGGEPKEAPTKEDAS